MYETVQEGLRKIPGMNCFFCSPADLNPDGLNLVFASKKGGAGTQFNLAKKFQSYPGMGHGGILSGILDETMAYAGIFELHCLPVTRSLQVMFRSRVPSREVHTCEAQIISSTQVSFEAEATIRNLKGQRLMSASAQFAILSQKAAEKILCMGKLDLGDHFRLVH